MDFDWDILLEESMIIMSRIKGFSYSDLIEMRFDRYEKIILILEEAKKNG